MTHEKQEFNEFEAEAELLAELGAEAIGQVVSIQPVAAEQPAAIQEAA